jgi:hypothetical protein
MEGRLQASFTHKDTYYYIMYSEDDLIRGPQKVVRLLGAIIRGPQKVVRLLGAMKSSFIIDNIRCILIDALGKPE